MESASIASPPTGDVAQSGDKGLKRNALSYVSNVVIGVASTAPGYSIAATLGFIVAVSGVGLQAPAVMLVAFVPMFCIAFAYRYMNKADPDCGTTFSWVTRGLGPSLGWLGGWAIVATDVIVMASLAQIAAIYTYLLFDWQSAADSQGIGGTLPVEEQVGVDRRDLGEAGHDDHVGGDDRPAARPAEGRTQPARHAQRGPTVGVGLVHVAVGERDAEHGTKAISITAGA